MSDIANLDESEMQRVDVGEVKINNDGNDIITLLILAKLIQRLIFIYFDTFFIKCRLVKLSTQFVRGFDVYKFINIYSYYYMYNIN